MHTTPPYVETKDHIRVRALVRGEHVDGVVLGRSGETVYLRWRSDMGNHLGWGVGGGCRAALTPPPSRG